MRRKTHTTILMHWMLAAACATPFGCTGVIHDETEPNGAGPSKPGQNGGGGSIRGAGARPGSNPSNPGGSTSGSLGTGGSSGHGDNDPGTTPDGVPLGTRLVRLTHEQYDKTVSDLLLVNVDQAGSFLEDPTFGGYDNSAEGLMVSGRLGRDYRRAAEELAAMAVSAPSVYSSIVPCTQDNATCADRFITEFGGRAFRRPLTNTEKQAYLALHAKGADLVASGDAFKDGVQVALEAFLQSPHFLYRVELSNVVDRDGFIALTGYEIASRLSYMLWNSMPDDELFRAAEGGDLATPEGIVEQAARMLEEPAAHDVVENFHYQWLDLERYENVTKSATLYPEFSGDLSGQLKQEALRFIDHVVFDRNEGLQTLLRAPYTFVDSRLAPLYGLTGAYDDEFVKADLDGAKRGGLLTQIGFLASHAYTTNTSPIHRGVFVLRRIICKPPPDPPPGVDFNLPPIEGEIKTTRQQVTAHTSSEACTPCHGVINPIGFGFEQFDSIGRFRTTENGEPIDSSGTIELDGESVSFADSAELLDAIVQSSDARRCYAKNWLRYAYGREDQISDAATLERLAVSIADPDYSVKNLLLDLTQTKSFRLRAENTVFTP